MTDIVHIGDGRYVHLEEGALQPPPPKPPKKLRGKRVETPSYEYTPRWKKPNKRAEWREYAEKIPGYHEWRLFVAASQWKYTRVGRPIGVTDGHSKRTFDLAMAKAKEQVKKDMANIKKSMELTEMAEEALEGALTVLRAPASQQTKLSAAKLILEFTKTKPVAKSEVSVNKAEEWLASLAHDIDE